MKDSTTLRLHGTNQQISKSTNQQITITYRVLPYSLSQSYAHLDSTLIQRADGSDYIGFDFSPYEPVENLTDFKGLDYSGSFSRGVSFGNSQNLVLNSNFNLQMAGNIGNDVEVLAAITDQNIPLQPEGNTQQLQEFDKIFIQLKKGHNKLIAGDYELARPNSYFMNYFKKLQGATFTNQSQVTEKGTLHSRISGAFAKGKFARNALSQQEGNQGPYRLRGNANERFIIIQAGTERVYIDGQLLKRGLEEDYVIDYNRADITFTPRRLITKDSRIIVEFEYTDQNYQRSTYSLDTEYRLPKGRVYFNLFSEQDSKTSGNIRDLDSLQLSILRNTGDDINNAFSPGIDTVEAFDEFQVRYKLVDTTYVVFSNGELKDTTAAVLVYSTDPDSARYTSAWTDRGPGGGYYLLDPSIPANGRAYRWVAPDAAGNPTGQYDPLIKLNAPNQQQLYVVGTEWQIGKHSGLQLETALSKNDLNRLSTEDQGDDLGLATLARYTFDKKLNDNWTVESKAQYEWVHKHFRWLNPYRNAEFNRDWNVAGNQNNNNFTINQNRAAEQLGSAGFVLRYKQNGLMEYNLNGFFPKG